MKKTILLIFIIIISLFTLTGCYYTNGIDNYYFIISLGLDLTDEGRLKLSVQTSSNSSGESGSSGSTQPSNYKIYSVEANTIDEGLNILDNYLNKKINLSHCSALIISEELAKKGIKTYMNTLSNNPELRHSCQIIISSTTAYDVMEKVSNSGEVFSARLYDYLTETTEYTGFTIETSFGQFFQALDNDYYQPTAVYTLVSDDTVQTAGFAIFKDEFMLDYMDVSNSIAHLIVTNDLNTCVITTDSPFEEGSEIDLKVSLYKKTDIDIDIINGTPLISVTIYPEGTVNSSGSTFNYIDNNNIKILENTVNSYFENLVKNYLYTISKKYNSDVTGFKALYKGNFFTREEFDKIHWDDVFQDSFFDVTINSKINSSNLFNKE